MIMVTCGVLDDGSVETLGENEVDDVDGGNIVSLADRCGCWPACPPLLPRPRIGYILTTMDDI